MIKNDEISALPYSKDYIKVPIQKTESEYICYLTNKYRRRYTHDTLPSYILPKLILISTVFDSLPPEHTINSATLMSEPPNALKNVGWRPSGKWYIVILNTDDYHLLQGVTNDTRKESKD